MTLTTIKTLVNKFWMATFCAPNNVYWMIKTKNGIRLKETGELDDLKNVIITETEWEMKYLVKDFVNTKKLPLEVDNVQISQNYPTVNDDMTVWEETISFKEYTIEAAKKFKINIPHYNSSDCTLEEMKKYTIHEHEYNLLPKRFKDLLDQYEDIEFFPKPIKFNKVEKVKELISKYKEVTKKEETGEECVILDQIFELLNKMYAHEVRKLNLGRILRK